MKTIINRFSRIWQDESGISSVEYALLLAFVAAGLIVGAQALSTAVQGEMNTAANCITTGVAANC